MRKFGLIIIRWKLKLISILLLWRYSPKIIGITGSVGKSSAKEAIYCVLKGHKPARRSQGSYNNEIGVPLTILGEDSPGSSIWGWIKLLFRAFGRFIYQKNYPKILILEMGVDKPKDIEYLTSFIKPDISVITSIGAAHLQQLGSEAEVMKEKAKLAYATTKKGVVILNFDDSKLRHLGLKIKRKVLFYGLENTATINAADIKYSREGMLFNLNYAGNMIPASVKAYGAPQVYAGLTAAAVGTALKMDLISIVQGLHRYTGLKGRLRLFDGKNGTYVLDDTYNSNPMSADASLHTALKIKEIYQAERLVVVLGDMLELGKISRRAHINLGRATARIADVIVAVGEQARAIEEGARQIKNEKLWWFADSNAAAQKIISIIKPNDLILIKGSQGVRMEKVSAVLLKSKKDIKHLPRMSGYWKGR